MTRRLLEAMQLRPLLLDAAIGTRLIARGLDLATDDPTLWCLTRPDDVFSLHQGDVAAGSNVLLTNTFGANSAWLDRFGRKADVREINTVAVDLARKAIGEARFVLGAIGPTAWTAETDTLHEQAEALLHAGVDGLILETFGGAAAVACLKLLRNRTHLPLIASVLDPMGWVDRLIDAGADVIGVNCVAPQKAGEMLRQIDAGIPLLWKPSTALAGVYDVEPEDFASEIPGLAREGVRLIGGCCGSTSAHLKAARRLLDHGGFE